MKLIITEEQYITVTTKLLEALYTDIQYKKVKLVDITTIDFFDEYEEIEDENGRISLEKNDIFWIYLKGGDIKKCKRPLYVPADTIEHIENYIPKAITRKKLFSKTMINFAYKISKIKADCVQFSRGEFDKKQGVTYIYREKKK